MSGSIFDEIAVFGTRAETAPEFHKGPNSAAPEFPLSTTVDAVIVDVDNSISVRVSVL